MDLLNHDVSPPAVALEPHRTLENEIILAIKFRLQYKTWNTHSDPMERCFLQLLNKPVLPGLVAVLEVLQALLLPVDLVQCLGQRVDAVERVAVERGRGVGLTPVDAVERLSGLKEKNGHILAESISFI